MKRERKVSQKKRQGERGKKGEREKRARRENVLSIFTYFITPLCATYALTVDAMYLIAS